MQKILGVDKHIDENTFGNRLKKFSFKTACQFSTITGKLGAKIHSKLQYNKDKIEIVDIDSSVKGVYGNQEGAVKGFNHKKHGKYVSDHLHLNTTHLLIADENDDLSVKIDENSGVAWFDIETVMNHITEDRIKSVYKKAFDEIAKIKNVK